MRLALASDHAGFRLKARLLAGLQTAGHDVIDLGVASDQERADYPDSARAVAQAILSGQAERGILICGSGVGVTIAANKHPGIYACICHDTYSAGQGVRHDNMNVLCLGAEIIGGILAEEIVRNFLAASFDTETERYGRRFSLVQSLEQRLPETTSKGS